MIIDENNCHLGNKAMASVLLLYYHLLNEGGITHDQTVYIDTDDFDGFSFLDVEVVEERVQLDIDEELIKEGAVIYLLCDLNDMVAELEDDYLSQPFTQKIIEALDARGSGIVPEADEILKWIRAGESSLDYPSYRAKLDEIYKKYVVARFRSFLSEDDQSNKTGDDNAFNAGS